MKIFGGAKFKKKVTGRLKMSAIKVRALYDFNSEYDNEMRHVLVGDVLTVLDKNVGDGWWKCCNLRTQEKGIIFPKKKN